jgi:hypothetical protein
MARIVLIFGLISGAIVAGLMWFMLGLFSTGTVNFDNGEIFGYATMLIALSMIFFGIKSYRDNNGGRIGFWKGIQVGLLISLISAACYGLSWEVYYRTSSSDFMQEYTTHYLAKMRERGASQADVEAAAKQMADIGEMYKNPVIRFAMTLMEILPVGIIVTLVSAALLRKREVLSAELA